MNNDINNFKKRLKNYRKKDIVITYHAKIRALVRNIDLEEVKNNIVNPIKLVYVKKLESTKEEEFKYECYFNYSKKYCHKYILVIDGKIIIVTIININRDWQRNIR